MLKSIIVEKGYTFADISDLLGLNMLTTYRKLSDIHNLTIREALLLKTVLNLSDSEAAFIFLGV